LQKNLTGKKGISEQQPHSLDLKPMDFFLWVTIRDKVYMKTQNFAEMLWTVSKKDSYV